MCAMYVGVDAQVPFSDDCLSLFLSLKQNSAYRYITYKAEDIKSNNIKVIVDSTSTPSYISPADCHPPTTSAHWPVTSEHTLSLGVEPLMHIMGELDIPEMFALRTVCRAWCKFIDNNEERLLHSSLVSGKHINRSFVASSVGFTSWRHFIMERMYEKKNYAAVWNKLSDKLPENECRFIVYNFHEPNKKPYYVFTLWAPDSATVRSKMVYTSTKMFFLRALSKLGVQIEQQASDKMELDQIGQNARAVYRSSSESDKVFAI